MVRQILFLTAFVLCAAGAQPAMANITDMKRLTEEMVKEAGERFRQIGIEQATIEFNDSTSTVWLRDPYHLHMFGMSETGEIWADNIFPEVIGMNFENMADFEGLPFGQMVIDNTPIDGSIYQIEIRFASPGSGDIVPGIGSCLRPEGKDVLCSWSEL
ncbi:MAG: hypothetical protein ACR2QJ_14740 [Geminicoccaceae bacterium]